MDLIEIKGKINTAICYARIVEDEAIEQIRRMCDYPMTEGSRIRIMPDVHSGKGCTIGTTMTITDKVVPNVVGVDIGCGMYTVNLGKVDIDFVKVDEAAHFIPSGMNVWGGRIVAIAADCKSADFKSTPVRVWPCPLMFACPNRITLTKWKECHIINFKVNYF